MAVKYQMQHFKFSTKTWGLTVYRAIDPMICVPMLCKSGSMYRPVVMKFLSLIYRLSENIQIALFFKSGKNKEKNRR